MIFPECELRRPAKVERKWACLGEEDLRGTYTS
jgi:hypothetical protein